MDTPHKSKFLHQFTPIEEVKKRLPPEVSIVEKSYQGIKSPAILIDKDYGEFAAIPDRVIRGIKFHPKRSRQIHLVKYCLPIKDFVSSLRDNVKLDETTYKNASEKCRLIDPVYGEFWMAPRAYRSGRDHPKRGRAKSAQKRHNIDGFVSKLPPHIVLKKDTFHGYKHLATFIINGVEKEMLPSSVLNKIRGTPKKGQIPSPTPIEEVLAKLPPELTLVKETYKSLGKKALFIDKDYGEWETYPSSILSGSRHPKRPKNRYKRTLSIGTVMSRLPKHIKIDESTYESGKKRATFIDEQYGAWEAIVNNVLRGHGHPQRMRDLLYTTEDDVIKCLPKEVTLVQGSFTNTYTKAKFYDTEFGEFEAYPREILRGIVRHPKMYHSRLEQFVGSQWGLERCNKMIPGLIRQFRPDFKISDKVYLNADGLRWHIDERRGTRYHWDVRKEFEDAGLRILQFRENEITKKSELIKSMIANFNGQSTKVYARNTEVRPIKYDLARPFLNENHLMGFVGGSGYLGLFHQERLVMVLGVNFKGAYLDFSRLATTQGVVVVGGLSKLVNYLHKKYPESEGCTSWVDLRYAVGNSLVKLGFKPIKTTLGYAYTDFTNVYSRQSCRANMDERKLSEKEHAIELGYYRISDAGQRLFKLEWSDRSPLQEGQ